MSTRRLLIMVGCLLLAILALTAHLAVATPPAQESHPTKPAVLDSSEAVIVENVTQALATPGGLQLPPASIAAIMTQNFEGTWPATGWQLIDASSNLSSVVRYSNATYTVPGARFASDASTRALWHFDEAAGATVFNDWSGYTNTLTGMNGAQTGNP